MWRLPPVILARLAALAALAAAACTHEAASAPVPPPPGVVAAPVAARDIDPWDELTGRVEAVDTVEIRARVAGYVTAVRYREGSDVAAGTVLFTIDPRPAQAALARATAELARARARAAFTRADAARAERLLTASAIPQVERDTAASVAAQADADVAAQIAAVELARLDVEFTQVRAPIAGRTGQALVSRGDYIAAGPAPTVLTTVRSIDPVHVYFTGDEQTYLRYAASTTTAAPARPVFVGFADETGYPHEAKVDFVDNRVDPATGTIRLRAVLANPAHRFAPGLYARVRLSGGAPVHALLVDDKAILTDQDRKFVYALGPGDVATRKDVQLGRLVDGLRVITSGLAPGDRVIVRGIQKIGPGMHVAVETAPAAQPGGPT